MTNRLIIFILIITLPLIAKSQGSKTIDSISVNLISSLPIEQNKNLFNLYSKSLATGFYKRLDSIKYENVFIQQTVSLADSSFNSLEFYFHTSSDILPFAVYLNGSHIENIGYAVYDPCDSKWYTQAQLIKRYQNLKRIQELNYDKIQYGSLGCISGNRLKLKRHYKEKRGNDLKETYQIQTCFVNSKGAVSLQTPPKNPKFKMVFQGHF